MKCDKANAADLQNSARYFSFEQQNNHQSKNINQEIRPPFQLHEHSLIDVKNAAETAAQITAANKPLTNPALCRYLHEKRISKGIADVYCFEVDFKIENNSELFIAIGFKNNTCGYKLRFLSFQTIHQNQRQPLTIFLVLNTLDLFARSLLLMEKHKQIHLYLKHDDRSRKSIQFASKRSSKYKDESFFYKDYKSLHNWLLHFGSLRKAEDLKESEGMGLP